MKHLINIFAICLLTNLAIGQVQVFDASGKLDFEYVEQIDSLDNAAKMKTSLNDFRAYISRELNYPKNSRSTGNEGLVIAKFYIDNFGKTSRLTIIQSVNEKLDSEAKRVIKSYKKWPVPRYKGKNSHFEVVVPINFRLS